MGRTLIRYKLNEQCKETSMQLAGINLTKNWKDFEHRQENLKPFIRTKERVDGILDMQVYDIDEDRVTLDTKKVYDSIEKIFTREELSLMTRDELTDVAIIYGINPSNKTDIFLSKLIQQKQVEYKNSQPVEEKVEEKLMTREQFLEELAKEVEVFEIEDSTFQNTPLSNALERMTKMFSSKE